MKFTALYFWLCGIVQYKFDVNDPKEIIIDFKESGIVDQSAIECIHKLSEKYLKNGKSVHLDTFLKIVKLIKELIKYAVFIESRLFCSY